MDLELSDDQRLFQETTRRFLENTMPSDRVRQLAVSDDGFDRATWAQGAELGWFSLLVAEDQGGGSITGAPLGDACIVAEEAGRAVLPGPLIPTNLVAAAIAAQGSPEQRDAHLGALMGGTGVAAWAFAEANERWDSAGVALRAEADGGGYRLSGVKHLVQDATVADVVLVTAREHAGVTQFLVPRDTPGLQVTPLESMDLARRFATVTFDDVVVPASAVLGTPAQASDAVDRMADCGSVLTCAETVGAIDCLYEMTLDYAVARKAFGRSIGSFQAIKHRFADMLVWLESAKAVTVAAARAVDLDVDRRDTVSIAKAYVSEKSQAIVRDCLQIHGGIGYTWEYDLHLFYRRVDSNAVLFGDARSHQDRIAEELGLDQETATCLYAALVTDTGFFRFPATTPRTLQMAAELVATGIDFAGIIEAIYERQSPAAVRLAGQALSKLVLEADGRVAWTSIPLAMFEAAGASEDDAEGITEELRRINGVEVLYVLRESADGPVRVSLRSKNGHDVNAMARAFGGGGHVQAAGCTIPLPLPEAEARLRDVVLGKLQPS